MAKNSNISTLVSPDLSSGKPHRKRELTKRQQFRRAKKRHTHNRFRRQTILQLQIFLFFLFLGIGYFTTRLTETFPGIVNFLEGSGPLLSDEEGIEGSRSLLERCNKTIEVISLSAEYPQDVIWNKEERKSAVILLHVFAILYTFIGLAVICDEYFEAALEGICEGLGLKEDVAGATFMAAGGSTPEFFTSVMGTFFSKSDIGFGTIVGSAVFNVLFVIAMCAFVTDNLALSWWPLTRDSMYYCFSICILVTCAVDQAITWGEAVILLLAYCGYVTLMYYNEQLYVYVNNKLKEKPEPEGGCRSVIFTIVSSSIFINFIYLVVLFNIILVFYPIWEDESTESFIVNNTLSAIFIAEFVLKTYALGFFGYVQDRMNAIDGVLVVLIFLEYALRIAGGDESSSLRAFGVFRFLKILRVLRIVRLYRILVVEKCDASTQTESKDFRSASFHIRHGAKVTAVTSSKPTSITQVAPAPVESETAVSKNSLFADDGGKVHSVQEPSTTANADEPNDEDDDDDDDDDELPYPYEVPEGIASKIFWVICLPLTAALYHTIPHCRRPWLAKYKYGYFLTFAACLVWITALSYVMVWTATLVGEAASITTPVMGLTVIAAGTSVPDLLSSIAVAKRGFGDMAVSSSIGSNVFDILIGLPVPWFFATAVLDPGSTVTIYSTGLVVMTLTLFLMVAAVVALINFSGWVMSNKLGYWMLLLYFGFLTESLLLESGYILSNC